MLIKKNALAKNTPSQDTEISNHHTVCYQGNMIQACELVKICKGVEFIRYNGETLYNVLLDKHSVMTINNLVCETLHPENVMAKIYGGNFNTAEKCKLLERLSTTVKPREIGIYNTLLAKMNGKNQDIYSELDVDFSSINIKKQNVTFRIATTPSKRF